MPPVCPVVAEFLRFGFHVSEVLINFVENRRTLHPAVHRTGGVLAVCPICKTTGLWH